MSSQPTVPDTASTRIALMGDLHFYRLWVSPWRLLSKRILGQINLWWDRRHSFDRNLLAPMLDRIIAIHPSLLLLTGDLTMTSLREEFDDVAVKLRVIGDRFPMVAVAGNHDRYTPFARRHRIMERRMPGLVPDTFPHVRPISQRWRLIALDAAMPRALSARGAIGTVQLARTAQELAGLTSDDGVVLMCHYPAIARPDGRPTRWNHRLDDASALRKVLQDCKATIIYAHGHVHWPWLVRGPHGIANLIDLNVGAPIMRKGEYVHGQGVWQLDLPEDPSKNATFTHHVPTASRVENGGVVLDWTTRIVP